MKRPRVVRTNNIGTWIYVLEFMAFVSIFTNIILFALASDQLHHLLPFLKSYHEDKLTSTLTIFGVEHLIVGLIIILSLIFDKTPNWVDTFFARQRY